MYNHVSPPESTMLCLGPVPAFVEPSCLHHCANLEELERELVACGGRAVVVVGEATPDAELQTLHVRFPQITWWCAHGHPCVESYLRTDMLRALAHAIRSPLGVLEGAVDELSRGMPQASLELGMLRRGLARLRRTATVLSDVASLERNVPCGESEGDFEVSLPEVAQAAWRDACEQLPLRKEVHFDLQQGDAQVPVRVRGVSLQRALRELLLNARQHASAEVRVQVAADPEGWSVRVIDDGPGPGPAVDARNWLRFVPASVRKARSDLALGLSIADQEVRSCGARLDIATGQGGRGTQARITGHA